VRTSNIDPDTPQAARTKTAVDGTTLQLVVSLVVRLAAAWLTLQFSDEFNTDGRSFYPDDDPYFTAVDLWYAGTQDLEVRSCFGMVVRTGADADGSGMIPML
jgi:hypothetical protein